MKRKLVKVASIAMSLCLLGSNASLLASAEGNTDNKDTSGIETTEKAVYYTNTGTNGKKVRTGIKEIKLDPYVYTDITGNKRIPNINTTYLSQAIGTDSTVLKDWSKLASAIFEAGGKYTCSFGSDYKKYFGSDYNNNKPKEDICVADALANTSATSKGSYGNDCSFSTGLSTISSFSKLRQKMGDSIANGIDRKTCDGNDILGQGDNCDDALLDLKDNTERTIIYNMATSITRDGKTPKYQYNSYGIAFYDFDLMVIADEDLEYVTAVEDYKETSDNPVKSAAEDGADGVTYDFVSDSKYLYKGKNGSLSSGNTEVSLDFKDEQSVLTSIQNSETYAFSQTLGSSTQINCGIGGKVCARVEQTFSLDLTTEQAYSTIKTHEEMKTRSVNSSIKTYVDLPAQTTAVVSQEEGTGTMVIPYDTPVALTFKVAIFCMSGDVYADSALTLAFSTSGYDQENFSTFFDGSTEAGDTYAITNLYNRYNNYTINGYDSTFGNNRFYYKKHNGTSATNDTDKDINWDAVDDLLSVDTIATKVPLLSAGTSMTVNGKALNSEISSIKPLYLPKFLKLDPENPKSHFLMSEDGAYNLSSVAINAYNNSNVEYYGFSMLDGEWKVSKGSENVIKYDKNRKTVTALKPGIGYMEWSVNDSVEYTAAEEAGKVTGKDLKPVTIAITVISLQNVPNITYKVKPKNQSGFLGTVGDAPVHMSKLLDVVDENGNVTDYPVDWEILDDEATMQGVNLDDEATIQGVNLDDADMVSFLEDGTYKVRAVVNPDSALEFTTDWIEVTPREEREIISAKLNKTELDKYTLITKYLKNHESYSQLGINIASYITCYDQYGDKWEGDPLDIECTVDNTYGIVSNESGRLVLNKAGDYKINISSMCLPTPTIGTISISLDSDIQHELGDVDGDNHRRITDVTLIQKYLANLTNEGEFIIDNADVNGDGKVDILDSTYIQKYLAFLITD